jgi:hypothetical protein
MSAVLQIPDEISAVAAVRARVADLDWARLAQDLDSRGCATLESLLTAAECAALAELYPQDSIFRSRVAVSTSTSPTRCRE